MGSCDGPGKLVLLAFKQMKLSFFQRRKLNFLLFVLASAYED